MHHSKDRERGSVLVYTLILVTVAVFLAVAFLGSREEWLRGQNRRLIRTFFELDSEISLNQLNGFIQNQIATSLSFNPSTLTGTNGPFAGGTQSGLRFDGAPVSLYSYSTPSIAPASVISLSPLTYPTTLLQSLTYPATSLFDPFYGARALSSTFIITQAARPVSSAETEYSKRQRVTTVGIRQVPLSVFTVFSNTSALISSVNFPNGLGRVHIEGQAQISGHVSSSYPFTATGRLNFSPGATLTAQRSPAENAHTADANSTVNDLKGAFENVIVDQDVNHSHEVIVPNLLAQLSVQCQIAITLSPAGASFTAVAQQGTDPATAALIGSQMTVDQTSWLSKSFPTIRIIVFDFNNFRTLGLTSYFVTSADKTAVVLVKHAGVLGQNLSIVTDLAVWVSNGFNDGTVTSGTESNTIYGSQAGYNPSLYAASIVSPKVVGVNTGP
ncbi:MAG: hypothetical protein WB586_08265 [Chthoniobacterales bacterium]